MENKEVARPNLVTGKSHYYFPIFCPSAAPSHSNEQFIYACTLLGRGGTRAAPMHRHGGHVVQCAVCAGKESMSDSDKTHTQISQRERKET